MDRTYDAYMASAKAKLAEGFPTKAARKDALDDVGRAYDLERAEVHKLLLNEKDRLPEWDKAGRKANHDLYWGVPMYVHQWSTKTGRKFEMYPGFADRADNALALRNAIKAAPDAPKPVTKKEVEAAVRDVDAMTCQICGRKIYAETGVIAHHGYQRPGTGWQTDSCRGARQLPFEVSRDQLAVELAWVGNRLAGLHEHLAQVKAEKTPIAISWIAKGDYVNGKPSKSYHSVSFTRATFAERTQATEAFREFFKPDAWSFPRKVKDFDHYKRVRLAEVMSDIEGHAHYFKSQADRWYKWTQTQQAHTVGGKFSMWLGV